jgi:CDP-diacylglycerol--glycerol-3-phosphate 3-phosphatidyltransferase
MPSIYQLKPAFQTFLRPVTRGLASLGVTANQVTIATVLLSGIAGSVIACPQSRPSWMLLIPVALFIRMALNAIDGMLAREHYMNSRLGAVLNELGDVLADAMLYLPLALVPGLNPALVVSFVVLGIIVEMTGVVAIQIGAARNYAGPIGKSDRAFLFGLIALLLGVGVSPGLWSTALLSAGVLLSAATIVNRARLAIAEVP